MAPSHIAFPLYVPCEKCAFQCMCSMASTWAKHIATRQVMGAAAFEHMRDTGITIAFDGRSSYGTVFGSYTGVVYFGFVPGVSTASSRGTLKHQIPGSRTRFPHDAPTVLSQLAFGVRRQSTTMATRRIPFLRCWFDECELIRVGVACDGVGLNIHSHQFAIGNNNATTHLFVVV
jgi:hypothetical protein